MKQIQRRILTTARILFGLLFLDAGIEKLLNGFSAKKYLEATTYGPFADIFQSMAGSPVVDFLVVGGEIAIGIALVSGVFLWFTAYAGSLMMIMYYFSQFPPKTGIINMHIIYILLFFILAACEAGKYAGLQPFADRIMKQLFRKSS
ncbi:DoxX family protein [Candidatus Roizmanbacteria bacterium]|nr:MAG: DoxX family protein [Candidatus Roizmanbacteria bacterium]